MALPHLRRSTTVRIKRVALRTYFRCVAPLTPHRAGQIAANLWFAAPPRMSDLPLPTGGRRFQVQSEGHVVNGLVWGDIQPSTEGSRTVYLVHGWGGRGAQFGSMVQPLLAAGRRVVMFDAPAHGTSPHGRFGPRRSNGVEFAKALDAVFCKFGPAETVVAHSLGVIATYVALRFGWFGTKSLVAIAPLVESQTLFHQFQHALGFGERTRAAFDRIIADRFGMPVAEFDVRFQAARVEPMPTFVIAERGDRQTPFDDVAKFASDIGAPLLPTEGLGHRKVLSDPDVVRAVVDFVARRTVEFGSADDESDASSTYVQRHNGSTLAG